LNIPTKDITAVILAGGRGARIGGQDKGLIPLNGRPLIAYVIDILRPQVHNIVINANRHRESYEQFGYPVQGDELSNFQGPLAGLQQALRMAKTPWVVTTPCDTPFIPTNLVDRLYNAVVKEEVSLAIVHDGKREQPLLGIFSTSLCSSLDEFLAQGHRTVMAWVESAKPAVVDFSHEAECFKNLNTLEEIRAAEERLKKGRHVE
jgi:molybdenum cofactor guanylyltransferase